MPAIMNIPPSYGPAPYQSRMPQLMQSFMMNYMSEKYATDRQKKDWDRRDKEAEADRKFQEGQTAAKAKLGKLKYLADMRKDHIRLSGPDKVPAGYEQSDVIAGLNNETYWVKRKERKPIKFHKITPEGILETQATYTGEIENLKEQNWKRGAITPPADKETWDKPKWNKKLNAVTITSSDGNMKVFGKKGWVPATEAQYMKGRKAGAPTMIQTMRAEESEIKQEITTAAKRTTLLQNKRNKVVYGAEGYQFNTRNKQNEVAYWHTGKGLDGTRVVSLPAWAIEQGLTPLEIQRQAKGKTVERVLKDLKIIE